MTWRDARSIDVLRDEVNERWPQRDKASDGTKGDSDHQSRKSDHNPNAAGHVRARDIDDDLRGGESDPFWLAEHIRLLGKAGFAPLQNGGYVIYFARIASEADDWAWRTYTGPNAHKTHIHVSVSRHIDRYDSTESWRVDDVTTTDPPKPRPSWEDDMLKIVQCRDHPTAGEFLTNCINSVRTLSEPALVHGRNLGYYPQVTDHVPHDWLVWVDQVQAGHHDPESP